MSGYNTVQGNKNIFFIIFGLGRHGGGEESGEDAPRKSQGSLSKGVFERHRATGSGRFSFLGSGCALIFKLIVPIRVKTYSITNVEAPRRVKRENASFPVAARRLKTALLKVAQNSFQHLYLDRSL